MLMMFMAAGFSADGYGAHGGGVLERAIGQLMRAIWPAGAQDAHGDGHGVVQDPGRQEHQLVGT